MSQDVNQDVPVGGPTVVVIEKQGNGLAVAALVIAIVAGLISLIPFIGLGAVFVAIVAIGLAVGGIVVGRKRNKGVVMSVIAAAISVGAVFMAFASTSTAVEAIDEGIQEFEDVLDTSDEYTAEIGAVEFDGFASTAPITITSVSDETVTLLITVAADSPDGTVQYGTASVIITDLKPGQTATDVLYFIEEIPGDAVLTISDSM